MAFYANGYTELEVFARADAPGGGIHLYTDGEEAPVFRPGGDGYYRWLRFPLRQQAAHSLQAQNCRVSLAYLSGGADLAARGVAFLSEDLGHVLDPAELAAHYDAPYRESFHFSAWAGWMNDPNGLCWYKGLYHIFYQYNPHAQQWDNMYWGHAVSEDLLHWRHMPVTLEPQPALWGRPEMAGGAFSGSAVPQADGIRLFFTRHEETKGDPATLRETQWSALCQDGTHVEDETLLLAGPAPSGARDIRDPKVGFHEGKPYMVLGSAIQGRAAVLLYTAAELDGPWEYQGPLFYPQDATPASVVECPDLFQLDGQHVLLEATTRYTDPSGRIQPVRYHVGRYDGTSFYAKTSGLLDFGGNFYAAQSFAHEGRRLMLGWVSDFYEEHRGYAQGVCGSFSLPRELSIEDGALICRPAKEVYALKGKRLYSGGGENVHVDEIPHNAYYASIRLQSACNFEMCLAHDGEDSLVLFQQGDVIGMRSSRVRQVQFLADIAAVQTIEVFYDHRTAEVCLNNGQAMGTKTFYCESASGCFRAAFSTPEEVLSVEVWCIDSVWK